MSSWIGVPLMLLSYAGGTILGLSAGRRLALWAMSRKFRRLAKEIRQATTVKPMWITPGKEWGALVDGKYVGIYEGDSVFVRGECLTVNRNHTRIVVEALIDRGVTARPVAGHWSEVAGVPLAGA